jgi:SAM-dependent methyltransferase
MSKVLFCKICGSQAKFAFLKKGWTGVNNPSSFPYYRCTNAQCDFLYTDCLDDWSDLQTSSLYDGHTCGGGKSRAHLPLDKVNLAKTILPNVKKVLDVGCGEGLGVSMLREAGFEAYGYDVITPTICQDYITVGKPNEMTETYDIVTAIEVLEHLIDPLKTCHWIASLVKKGGIFAFSTYTFDPKKHDATWWYLNYIGHVSLHTRSSLSLLAQATGFRVVTDIFATHIWIRGDSSVPIGADTLIKTKHLLNKALDSQSYNIVLNRIKNNFTVKS